MSNRLHMRALLWAASLMLGMASVRAQDHRAHFRIRYVINRPEVDTTFVDNTARIADMRAFLETLRSDSLTRVTGVRFAGTASPDGAYEFNVWLSENRLRSFKELVYRYVAIPDSLIHANTSEIPWDGFRAKVAASDLPHREEILSVIDEGPNLVPWFNNRRIDARLLKLKRMYRGTVWEQLKEPILRDLRYGDALFEYYRMQPAVTPARPVFGDLPPADAAPLPAAMPEVEMWTPRLHLKTNLVGLALLSANVAVEVDLARHWSFALPVYYCAMDYFKSTVKFRNFTVQPEFRYWFRRSDNDGLFLGAHFGMSYYNFAFDGAYRYQDYRGRTPALGGGVSAGYRMPISRNKRWRMEFAVGAGIYPLDYSLFDNTVDVKDGQWMGRRKETYFGLDQAAVSFAYSFDLDRWKRTYRKKGGRK